MNHFTKEELKTILWHITTKASIEPGNELVPKIQDMIDNYCEHEPEGDFHVCVDKCKKCGVIVYD